MRAGAGARSGDGGVARDGSPVEVYRRLPPAGEAEIVDQVAPPGATILELGSGVGRVTRGLVALGHPVVAVDESEEMLAELGELPDVVPVRARIEDLALGRTFPVVLLGSHLVNTPEPARSAFLAAARRHLDPDGVAVIEVYPAAMRWAVHRASRAGDVTIELERVRRSGDRVSATVAYSVDGRMWRQRFKADVLDEPALRRVLEAAGFRFERWLDEARGWAVARPVTARSD
ncbi:MAG TPA: class I SAM-dependent methyltransferase [Candidatus Limnocylindrales bacterium]|nr:class I SAM-dependent methyltransferase [Candidatus Limnocylindrales bacterium]